MSNGLSMPFLMIDALGTEGCGVVGTSKASEASLAIPACIFVGVVNGVGSGLIRDVLVREEPLLFKPGQFYVTALYLGVAEFMLVTTYGHAPIVPVAISAMAIAFVFRLLAIFFDWRTRPVRTRPVMRPLPSH